MLTPFNIFIYRGMWFGLYDFTKEVLLKDRFSSGGSRIARFITANIITIFSGLLCYPMDTTRKRYQLQTGLKRQQYTSISNCFLKTLHQDGASGFYRGAFTNCFRSIGASFTIVLYDDFKKLLMKHQAH